MRLLNQILQSEWLKAAILIAVIAFFAACTKGGSITSSSTGSTVSGTLAITSIYPTASGSTWTPIVSSGRYYIKGLQLTLQGTCSTGTNNIQVNEGGSNYSETATCDVNGYWTWNKIYTSGSGEGDKTLTIAGYDINNLQVQGASTTQQVRIDNTAPNQPVITSPASSPYIYSSGTPSFNIVGTCSVDTDHITLTGPLISPSPLTVACAGGAFSDTVPLTPGSGQSFTFYAWDLAGNQSPGTVQTINYTPTLNLTMGNFSGARGVSGGHVLESSSDFVPGDSTSGASKPIIDVGFNYIINQERAQ
jgi:hypothetical protein